MQLLSSIMLVNRGSKAQAEAGEGPLPKEMTTIVEDPKTVKIERTYKIHSWDPSGRQKVQGSEEGIGR